MGAVRWTGKAFKIVGDLLTAEEVEQWIENEGRRFLEERLKKMALSAVFGKARSKRAIRSDAQKELSGRSEAFRTALQNTLEKFPLTLIECVKNIEKRKIKELYTEDFLDRVYVLPRDIASEAYRKLIVSEFADSAELHNFPGLVVTALANTAANAEQAFFDDAAKKDSFYLGADYELLGCDQSYPWRSPSIVGHYYVGFDHIGAPDKRFHEKMKPTRASLVDRIGRLSRDEHRAIIAALYDNEPTA